MSDHATEEIVISDIKEVSHVTMHLPEGGKEGPGTVVTFHAELLDSEGAQIAKTPDGFGLVYLDPNDKRVKEQVSGTDEFADGSIYYTGVVDIQSIIAGEPQVFRAFGVSGRYRGRSGTRSITVVGREDATTTVFTTHFSLKD
ncbi:allene oxide cyclase barrel-like domain-containing protein [Streptomyces odontomachi]|uniref:allene oxide cyclase barrel-like domain-containing protein n=1 Tax=Streptomyces odontomachi TaxID=2944940 RepID=UPI00210B9049|nr:hypothetical protein [Streptomyces sp. ODS25]